MGYFITFVASAILIWVFTWLIRMSDRIHNSEREITTLKKRLELLQIEKTSREIPLQETPADSEPAAPEPGRDPFAAAKDRAAESPPAKPLEPVLPPSPELPKAELPEESAPAPASPPPIPTPAPKPDPATGEPAPAPVPHPPEEKPLIEWRPILEKLKLWPPSGENAEAAIIGWWVTRAGIVTLIISAVFAGIRFSEKFPPWLWVLMLAGIAAGVTLLGAWLERRLQAFGRVISAGGLALGYFTAFAAFTLPAMKIIDDPAIGVFFQILALAVVTGWSFWKDDESLAAMAILLGFVSCGFSHHHDLENFVIAGLLLLAAAGGLMLVLRGWLWPLAVATAGSWGGFLILSIGKWSGEGGADGFWLRAGEAPEFPIVLGSLLLLTALLEAANCLAEDRGGDAPESRPRQRKWLSVINTSAAIAVGWIATKQVAPDRLDTFFLSFAILLFGITAVRYWRKHPVGLTETFFLKSAALLALFFVERFEGPTRWLSLAVEAGLVLWAFRRCGFRLVEIGFGAVFLTALGFIWKDVLTSGFHETWTLTGFPSFAGAATLVLLSVELALHSLWSPSPEPEKGRESFWIITPAEVFRFIAAAFTGFAAAAFAFSLSAETPAISRPVYLSIVALALAAPAIPLKRFPPVAAGLAALIPAYFAFFDFLPFVPNNPAGISAAIWFSLLAYGLAELAYRTWLPRWHAGNPVRAGLYGLGAVALADLLFRFNARFDFGTAGSVMTVVFFAAAGAIILILNSRRFGDDHVLDRFSSSHAIGQRLLAVLLGCITVMLSVAFLRHDLYHGAWLAVASAVLFAAAARTRNGVPGVAGGIPFLAAIYFYAAEFDRGSDLGPQLLCAAVLIAVSLGAALALWRFVDPEKSPAGRVFGFAFQAAALFVIHWIFRTHLAVSEVFFADALLAAAATAAGRLAPFRSLPVLSSLPLALALLHAGISAMDGGGGGGQIFWWLTAAVVIGWLWFLYAPSAARKDRLLDQRPLYLWHSAVASGVLTLAGYHALDNPWHIVSLTGFAVILAALWRWAKIRDLHAWSALPLGVGALAAFLRITGVTDFDPAAGLVAASLVAAGITGHGVILAFRNSKLRPLIWFHGFAAIGLVFLAYSPGVLGVDDLTTVCWGIAAIALFAIGLVAGLRPYRLVGLIGLGLGIARMVFIDIQDDLYRIFAFLAIAIVLLVIGYLYHRFRHLIERADHWEAESE